MKANRCHWLLAGMLLAGLLIPPAATAREKAKHQLLLLELDGSRLKLLQRNLVDLPLPRQRGPERVRSWRITATGKKGRVLLRRFMEDPRLLRAEFHGRRPGDPIEGVTRLRAGKVSFTVRLPASGVTRVVLEKLRPGLTLDAAPRADAWQRVAGLELGGRESRP